MIKQHGWDWPREALTPILTQPSYFIQATEVVSCNGVVVSFGFDSNANGLRRSQDYDVSIRVGAQKARGS